MSEMFRQVFANFTSLKSRNVLQVAKQVAACNRAFSIKVSVTLMIDIRDLS